MTIAENKEQLKPLLKFVQQKLAFLKKMYTCLILNCEYMFMQ